MKESLVLSIQIREPADFRYCSMLRHAVLIPLKATADVPPCEWVRRFRASFANCDGEIRVYVGVDFDDKLWESVHRAQARALLDFVEVVSPDEQPSGAVCAVWDALAVRAFDEGCNGLLILFGDDVSYEPLVSRDWVADAWSDCDPLGMFHPIDATSPSCCTFPIVTAAHIHLFRSLLPTEFVNQGGDLFLHELYRRLNAVHTGLDKVRVHNSRGGPVRGWPGHVEMPVPLYDKVQVASSTMTDRLKQWSILLAKEKRVPLETTIDVVVPTFRCDMSVLRTI